MEVSKPLSIWGRKPTLPKRTDGTVTQKLTEEDAVAQKKKGEHHKSKHKRGATKRKGGGRRNPRTTPG